MIFTRGALALTAPVSLAATSIGVDLGYQALSVRADLKPDTFIQVDFGSTGYGYGYGHLNGFSIGADYCKIYPRKKDSTFEPDIFYGFGGEVISLGSFTLLAGRIPFGLNWQIKNTPLEVGVAAVPYLVFGDRSFSALGISIPFRWVIE